MLILPITGKALPEDKSLLSVCQETEQDETLAPAELEDLLHLSSSTVLVQSSGKLS